MKNGVQTSLWIKQELYTRMKIEGLNFTSWVNETLEQYFSMNHKDQILKKLLELDSERKTLETRLKVLEEKEKQSITGRIESDSIFEMLYKIYCARREKMGEDESLDWRWITSPKNYNRCKTMKMNPDEVLQLLIKTYNKEK